MTATTGHSVYAFVHLFFVLLNNIASAQVTGDYTVRLKNSQSSETNPLEGRLEIYYNRTWGTVCDDGFTTASAKVACASLGFGYIGVVIGNRHGGGTGRIWLDDVGCFGSEYGIDRCQHSAWGSHNCKHEEDVSISCGTSGNFAVRLVNSLSPVSNPMEGRLEIFYNGVWGTFCDDSFTNSSVQVACASLGFGYVGTVINNRHGNGTGRIWLDNVVCAGTEQSIDRCQHNAWGSHDCSHSEDVSISCGATPRLVSSLSAVTNPKEGRLEIYYAGEWGTVCDDSFTNISAQVACQSMGFGNVGVHIGNLHGTGTGRIWLDNVICTGTERSIDRCSRNPWGQNDCSHGEDVSIRCGTTPDYAVRLINTLADVSTPVEGRLEIYYAGLWGTVCDDSFTNAGARVACASLGFGYSGIFIANRHVNGTGQIWLDEVNCAGNESGIHRCLHNAWGAHNCDHREDVSIRCGNTSEFSTRLINSIAKDVKTMEGELEIYYSGVWGVVCDHGFTHANARVACASLGFGYIGKFIGNRHGTGRGKIWLDDIICNGTERNIANCAHSPWGSLNCNYGQIVSVKCGDTEEYSVRLINSQNPIQNPMEGRLEIFFAGVWGTVCDDRFTNVTAKIVCASLGYGYVGTSIGVSHHGAGTGLIWLDDAVCAGGEQSIDKCTHRLWGVNDCNHNEDVSVRCGTLQDFKVRLVNSFSHISNPKEGRLEIYYSGSWGTVCDDSFTNASARVACASLGFGHNGTFIGNRHGNGTGQIWLKDVVCAGSEQSIYECNHSSWGARGCTHFEDVSISCGVTTRLVNSLYAANNPEEGRLEIYYGGVWGTVCNDNFTDTNAKVACASLGFGYIGIFIGNRHGNGTGQIWLDGVACNGTEQRIDMCSRNSLGVHDCNHNEDVSIRCGNTRDFAVRLINSFGYSSKEGRLEIYYSGIWGTVCNDHATNSTARVACASLGFGYVGALIENRFGGGTDAIWLDDLKCNGTESSIEQCTHRGWGIHNCGHGEDIAISCGTSVRLVNSTQNRKEGRLEIYFAGVWGTVCDDGFNNISARVACYSLGFGRVGHFIESRYGSGTGQIWLDDVVCNGTEKSLDHCRARPLGEHNCNHGEDVSISCGTSVRLVNSTRNNKEGRLEINFAGVWGTVCDDHFNNISARVVCYSLGFGRVGYFIGSRYGSGTGQIWLDDVVCNGNETSLDQCSAQLWGVHNCGHGEDVSISCEDQSSTRSPSLSTASRATTHTVPATSKAPTSQTQTSTSTSKVTVYASAPVSMALNTKATVSSTMSSSIVSRLTSTLVSSSSTSHNSPTSTGISSKSTTASTVLSSVSTSCEKTSVAVPSSTTMSSDTFKMPNGVTSKKPSGLLTTPSKSHLLKRPSDSPTIAELPDNSALTNSGSKGFWIIGIVGAIVAGAVVVVLAVFLRRRHLRSELGSTGADFPANVNLLTLRNPTFDHGNDSASEFLYDDFTTVFAQKHCNIYTNS